MTRFGFSKACRLLTPKDYQRVFDRADVKVSSRELLILARCEPNCEPPGEPRIGLVIARKNVRHSVQRNRIKRQIRESFRLNRASLGTLDAIVLARRGIDQLDNTALREQLQQLWQQLQRKAQRFSRELT